MSSLLFTLASVYGHALPSVQHSNRPFDAGHSPQSTINLIVTVNKIKKKRIKKNSSSSKRAEEKKRVKLSDMAHCLCVCVYMRCV